MKMCLLLFPSLKQGDVYQLKMGYFRDNPVVDVLTSTWSSSIEDFPDPAQVMEQPLFEWPRLSP